MLRRQTIRRGGESLEARTELGRYWLAPFKQVSLASSDDFARGKRPYA